MKKTKPTPQSHPWRPQKHVFPTPLSAEQFAAALRKLNDPQESTFWRTDREFHRIEIHEQDDGSVHFTYERWTDDNDKPRRATHRLHGTYYPGPEIEGDAEGVVELTVAIVGSPLLYLLLPMVPTVLAYYFGYADMLALFFLAGGAVAVGGFVFNQRESRQLVQAVRHAAGGLAGGRKKA